MFVLDTINFKNGMRGLWNNKTVIYFCAKRYSVNIL